MRSRKPYQSDRRACSFYTCVGYARVSTEAQNLDRQLDAPKKYGVYQIYNEKMTGTKKDRPKLAKLIDRITEGDVVVIEQIAKTAVNPDEGHDGEQIRGAKNEDSTIQEGTVAFDIRFYAVLPKSGETIRLIINVEAQNLRKKQSLIYFQGRNRNSFVQYVTLKSIRKWLEKAESRAFS